MDLISRLPHLIQNWQLFFSYCNSKRNNRHYCSNRYCNKARFNNNSKNNSKIYREIEKEIGDL